METVEIERVRCHLMFMYIIGVNVDRFRDRSAVRQRTLICTAGNTVREANINTTKTQDGDTIKSETGSTLATDHTVGNISFCLPAQWYINLSARLNKEKPR